MAFLRIFSRAGAYVIEPMRPGDEAAAAKLHVEGFGRAWTDGEFAALLAKDTVFGFHAKREGKPSSEPVGFVLARLAGGEAEILTIAVSKSRRRKGLGRALMDAVLRYLHTERANELFLEVGEGNIAAIMLYRRLGFAEVSRRTAYYDDDGGDGTALVMRLDLG